MIRKSKLTFILIILLFMVSCDFIGDKNQDTSDQGNSGKNSQENRKQYDDNGDKTNTGISYSRRDINYTIWTTYWDTLDLESEVEKLKNDIDSICYFAAYFNKDKNLFIPKESSESLKKMKRFYGFKEHQSYLTYVNDVILDGNRSSLKDIEILYSLFETEESMNQHVEKVLQLAMQNGFDGIEIDYEGIKNDIGLWELFIQFIDKLYHSANKKNIPIRILLEPNAPLEQIILPNGPEYVMMCYNLYGVGTDPGPKANEKFIKEMIKKMEMLPGKLNFALATGGFDFSSTGMVQSLTEKEAVELLNLYNKTATREEGSQALYFHYTDEEGTDHEVWYGDHETIKYWIGIIQDAGDYGISIWRVGGNIWNS